MVYADKRRRSDGFLLYTCELLDGYLVTGSESLPSLDMAVGELKRRALKLALSDKLIGQEAEADVIIRF